MNILGALGIDAKLLIVQLINFLVLLMILKKFVYHPIIERIEKDEHELEKARNDAEKLHKEREEFEDEQAKAVHKTKKRAEEILEEAETIADSMKVEAKEKIKDLIKENEERLDHLNKSYKLKWKNDWQKQKQDKIYASLHTIFSGIVTKNAKTEIQAVFFDQLCELLETTLSMHSKGNPRLGDVVLEYTPNVTKTQEKQLTGILDAFSKKVAQQKLDDILHPTSAKSKNKKKEMDELIKEYSYQFDIKENDDLICGFQLEVLGRVIQANLSAEIYEAIQHDA